MTVEKQDQDSADPSEPAQQMTPENDFFLQTIVGWANRLDIEMGITLTVRGLVISGTLTGGEKYFEHFANAFADSFPDDWTQENREAIRTGVASYAEIYRQGGDEERDVVPAQPVYIHLNNARVFDSAGAPLPGNLGVWWRGRISEVSGFWLGSLSHSTN